MRRLPIVIVLTLLVPTLVWALGSDHPKPVPNQSGSWPDGMADLVNAENRVHGFWVNSEDVFFFIGTTKDLNLFLERCAKLPASELTVVIHPGRLEVRSPWDKEPRDLYADWRLHSSIGWEVPLPDGDKKQPIPTQLRVDVYLGTSIELDKLVIPDSAKVKSGGEIEAFIKKHQRRPAEQKRPELPSDKVLDGEPAQE